MKVKHIIISLTTFLFITVISSLIIYLYQENIRAKQSVEQSSQQLEEMKINAMKEEVKKLQNELDELKKNEDKTEETEPIVEKSLEPQIPLTANEGKRYCPALKLCGEEYTDDYTCNNATCCKVNGVTMISFSPHSCDEDHETLYLKSINKTYKCQSSSIDSIKSMESTLFDQLEDAKRCMYSGGSEDECKKYVTVAKTLDSTISSNCIAE